MNIIGGNWIKTNYDVISMSSMYVPRRAEEISFIKSK